MAMSDEFNDEITMGDFLPGLESMNPVQTRRQLASLSDEAGNLERGFRRSALSAEIMGTAIKTAAIVSAVAMKKLVVDTTSAAVSYEANVYRISQALGQNGADMIQWSQTNAKSLGMSRAAFAEYGATFGTLFSGLTSDIETNAIVTQNYLKQIGIIAAGSGKSVKVTAEKIRSGILGATEAIDDLGIEVKISMIESTRAFKTFAGDKSWSQLDIRAQNLIRTMAILEQGVGKYGTSLAAITSTRMNQLSALFQDVSLTIGQTFLPILNAVIPYIYSIGNAILYAVTIAKQFTNALFGVSDAADEAAKKGIKAALGQGSLAAGLEKSKKAAGSNIQSFDELNLIQEDTADTDAGGGADTGLGDVGANADAVKEFLGSLGLDVELPEIDVNKMIDTERIIEIANTVKETFTTIKTSFAEFIDGIDFETIRESLSGFGESLLTISGIAFDGLSFLVTDILAPLGEWAANNIVPIALDLTSVALDLLSIAIQELKPYGMWLWDEFIRPLGEWTGGVIVTVLTSVRDALVGISDWCTDNKETLETITQTVGAFFVAWGGLEIMSFIGQSGGLITALASIATKVAEVTVALIANSAALVINAAKSLYLKLSNAAEFINGIKEVAIKMALATQAIIANTAAWLLNKAQLVLTTIATTAQTAATWLMDTSLVANTISVISNTASWVANKAVLLAGAIAGGTMAVVTGGMTAAQWLLNAALTANPIGLVIIAIAAMVGAIVLLWNTSTNFRVGVLETWRLIKVGTQALADGLVTAFTWAKDSIILVWESIKHNIKFSINLIIGFINMFIRKVNSIKIDIPKVNIPGFGEVGGVTVGFSIPEIPKLAKGGIVNSSTIAEIGEGTSSEAVIPLNESGLAPLINGISNAIVAAQNGGGGQQDTQPAVINLVVDGRVLASAMYKYNEEERQNNVSTFISIA